MPKPLIWVHDDMLSAEALPFRLEPEAQALYVFDPSFIEARLYGLKRLVFISECVREIGETRTLSIRKGETVSAITEEMERIGAERLVTLATPDPFLRGVMGDLRAKTSLDVLDPPPFVALEKEPDLKRFSRYWRKAEKHAFRAHQPSQGSLL